MLVNRKGVDESFRTRSALSCRHVDCISNSSDARTKRSLSSNLKTSVSPTLSFTQSEQRKKKFNGNLKQFTVFSAYDDQRRNEHAEQCDQGDQPGASASFGLHTRAHRLLTVRA